jgi:hypothetical protein
VGGVCLVAPRRFGWTGLCARYVFSPYKFQTIAMHRETSFRIVLEKGVDPDIFFL